MANDLVHLKAQINWEWQNNILHEFHSVIDELDKKRLVTICEHFKIDLSDLQEFINSKQKPRTNADKIRSMSDEEMAEFITARHYTPHCPVPQCEADESTDCDQCWLNWLRKEAE